MPEVLGLGATGLLRDDDTSDTLDKVDVGLAYIRYCRRFNKVTGIEADASWRGSKALADAPTRWGRIKQRAQAFRGVLICSVSKLFPAAMYLYLVKAAIVSAIKKTNYLHLYSI